MKTVSLFMCDILKMQEFFAAFITKMNTNEYLTFLLLYPTFDSSVRGKNCVMTVYFMMMKIMVVCCSFLERSPTRENNSVSNISASET